MNTASLETKFSRMGARLKVADWPNRRSPRRLSLDVGSDRLGEFFEVVRAASEAVEINVLDLRPTERHLLLLVRRHREKSKYLCGHDERHWFVAGIPEKAPVGTVRQAFEALKPVEVRAAQARHALRSRAANRRKNAAFVRQGEWFFLPEPRLAVSEALVLHHEPLSRGNGGKPHWVDCCYRTGGRLVYVCRRHPSGVPETEYRAILAREAGSANWGWQTMRRNPLVYVRGRVRHADHATITLNGWHRVVMNTENQSVAMRHVAFLD